MTLFKKKKQEPDGLPAEPVEQPLQAEDANPDQEPEVTDKLDPEVDPEVDPEAEPEVEPEAKPEAEPEVAKLANLAKVATTAVEPDPFGESDSPLAWLDPSDPLMPFLTTLTGELEDGMLSDETRKFLTRALNYDRDMLQTKAEAELAGRNAAIEEHLISQDDSDGVPHPGCGQGASPAGRKFSIFDLARDAMM